MGVRPRTALAVTLGVFAAAGVVALVLVAASLGGPQFPSEEDLPELPMGYSYAEPAPGVRFGRMLCRGRGRRTGGSHAH